MVRTVHGLESRESVLARLRGGGVSHGAGKGARGHGKAPRAGMPVQRAVQTYKGGAAKKIQRAYRRSKVLASEAKQRAEASAKEEASLVGGAINPPPARRSGGHRVKSYR